MPYLGPLGFTLLLLATFWTLAALWAWSLCRVAGRPAPAPEVPAITWPRRPGLRRLSDQVWVPRVEDPPRGLGLVEHQLWEILAKSGAETL